MKFSRSATATALVAGVTWILWACGGSEGEREVLSEAATPAVTIVSPSDHRTFEGSVTVRLETHGVEIRPAGTDEPGTGHHHLFIDRDITPVGEPIPSVAGIVHLGMAQMEYVFEDLPPGDHTIIAVLGDHVHTRLPNVATDTVHVTIAGT